MQTLPITGCKQPFPPNELAMSKLPQWSQDTLSGYSQALVPQVKTDQAKSWYISIANRTLQFFQAQGASDVGSITYRMMQSCVFSFTYRNYSSLHSFARYIGEITNRPYFKYLANLPYAKKVIWDNNGEFKRLSQGGLPIEQVNELADKLYQYRKQHGYSKAHCCHTLQVKTDFCIFLAVNDLSFTLPVAKLWCQLLEKPPINIGSSILYASLCWIDALAKGHQFDEPLKFYITRTPAKQPPQWAQPYVTQFIERRKQDRLTISSLKMANICIIRFVCYLDEKAVHSFKDLTIELIKSFNIEDTSHKTAEAKNAYNVRIRQFLRWLYEGGVIDKDLSLALPTNSAAMVRPVVILSKEQQDRLDEYCHQDPEISSTYYRDVAMIKLMRYLGLRTCDVVGLKFGSLDLQNQRLHLNQKKTGKALSLPLPTHVLNSIVTYIKKERPTPLIKSELIFLAQRAPFRPLGSGECGLMLKKILSTCSPHTLRRTFATEMMNGQTDLSLIAQSLGHNDYGSLHKYLNTDQKRMLACTLTLKGMNYKGSLL